MEFTSTPKVLPLQTQKTSLVLVVLDSLKQVCKYIYIEEIRLKKCFRNMQRNCREIPS